MGIKGLRCPGCGAEDSLVIDAETADVRCLENLCDDVLTPTELREQAKGLERLAAWCEACPVEKQS